MIISEEGYLEHHGVKGQKWGIRHHEVPGVPHSTSRAAKKDAHEYARAKLFYGEGAGTRRKLIKNKVEGKSKLDPLYKKAFDHHLSREDLAKHVTKAQAERHRKDAVKGTAKTARGVKNFMLRNGAPVSLTAATIGLAASNPRVRATVKNAGMNSYSTALRYYNGYKLKKLIYG